ncbi:MAG: FtsX-like permease family protein [Acidobacteriaceae bacterium]|nr:FtsX-like permease family protein [Acidobacteriaceae bacterium]
MLPPATVYVPISILHARYPGRANVTKIALEATKRASVELAREQIDPNLEREGIRVSGDSSKGEFRFAVDQHVLMIYVFLVLAACIIAGVGGLGLMTTMGINVLERRRELGILRAIGATPTMISAIVMGEAVTIAIIAWGVALVLAYPVTKMLTALLGELLHGGFDSSVAPLGMLIAFAASVVLGALASSVAARSAVRLTVREALAYE